MPRILTWVLLFSFQSSLLLAQAPVDGGGGDEVTDKVTQPGKGPQIPFDEARWEFWWFYNREPLIGLRQTLTGLAPGNADVDVPFQEVTPQDREGSLVPLLVTAMRDKNPQVRLSAVQSLAKTQDAGARPSLYAALRDELFQVRVSAIVALGVWGNTVSLPRLEAIVHDDKRELQERMYAALAIGLIGGPQADDSLRQLLAPSTFSKFPTQVQTGIAYGAGLSGSQENAPLLRALLASRKNSDFMVTSYLVLALGKCGVPEEDLATLALLLESKETQLRRSAAIALGILGRESGHESVVKALANSADSDADLMVRNFSFISLGYVGGGLAGKTLRSALGTSTKAQRAFVAIALGLLGDPDNVQLLMDQLDDENDPSNRGAMAIALGLHRDARAAPTLRNHYKTDREPVFRGYAALALGMIGDVEAISHLQKGFDDATDVEFIANNATALGLLGDRTSAAKLAAMARKERNEFVKQSLLYAMGLIGDRTVIEALGGVVRQSDEVAYVRGYAVTALGFLSDPQSVRAIARLSHDSNYTINQTFLNELFSVL